MKDRSLPEKLYIAGLDGDGPADLADPHRIDEPKKKLIRSIARVGVRAPAIVCSWKGKLWVVDGRQRVMAARIVNEQKKADKDDHLVEVPYYTVDGQVDQTVTKIAANGQEYQRRDPPWVLATKAQELLDQNHPREYVCEAMGISNATLGNFIALNGLKKDIFAKVVEGEIPMSEAYRLGRLPKADQKYEPEPDAPKAPSKKTLLRAASVLANDEHGLVAAVLVYAATGDTSALDAEGLGERILAAGVKPKKSDRDIPVDGEDGVNDEE